MEGRVSRIDDEDVYVVIDTLPTIDPNYHYGPMNVPFGIDMPTVGDRALIATGGVLSVPWLVSWHSSRDSIPILDVP